MRILIIGSLEGQISSASQIAISKGAKISVVENNEAGLSFLREGKGADLILTDVFNDIKFLSEALAQECIYIQIIVCGRSNDKAQAVKAIENGASEYIPLPPDEKLIVAILESISQTDNSIVGCSTAIKTIVDLAKVFALSDATILITGESGTGKEVFSKFIHSESNRRDKVFVSLNCAAIPDNLLESELFGHEKGAFTGAIARRIGKFEEANGGTLLLDEISEIDMRLQTKLLRAIQEREIERVGGNNKIELNIRIIATSNRDLKKAVNNKEFRNDLYHRLNVVNLHLPSLRDRKEDIEMLANHFIKKYTLDKNNNYKKLSQESLLYLEQYDWPGNIRELENVIYRAVILSKNDYIKSEDFMLNDTKHNNSFSEEHMIISALKYCAGNEIDAANILGLTIECLKAKLDKYVKI